FRDGRAGRGRGEGGGGRGGGGGGRGQGQGGEGEQCEIHVREDAGMAVVPGRRSRDCGQPSPVRIVGGGSRTLPVAPRVSGATTHVRTSASFPSVPECSGWIRATGIRRRGSPDPGRDKPRSDPGDRVRRR